MTKNIYLAILCQIFSVLCFSQVITIQASIADVDTVMMMVLGSKLSDTVYTTNGKLQYTAKLPSPEMLRLIFIKTQQSIEAIKEGNEGKMRSRDDGAFREIFAEEGLIKLECIFSAISNTRPYMATQASQDRFDEFKKRFNPLVQMARVIIDSSYTADSSQSSKKIFRMLYDKLLGIESDVAEKFVLENTDNAAGAYILYRYCHINESNKLDSIYHLFDRHLSVSNYLAEVKTKIQALSALKPGGLAPDFSAISNIQQPVSLTAFKGKFIVLDFWGSWCKPCINGLSRMKEYYLRYNHQVEFIGIACNDLDADWKKAIQKYQLIWPQIRNGAGVNDIGKRYNIQAFPTKIIIDKTGNFLYSFEGEDDAFYKQLEKML
jgi:thiol-disulfide isomerase/thioredoxin